MAATYDITALGELDREVIESSRVFHVGSFSLTDEPARSATLAALLAS